MALFLMVLGCAMLVVSAEGLVRGTAALAARVGVPSLVIGLTVVAFGTSSPELVASAYSSAIGQSDVAIGNVIGSNLFNVLVVLGLSAATAPLVVSARVVRLEVPITILVSAGLYFVARDGLVTRGDGLVLLMGLAAFTVWSYLSASKESPAEGSEQAGRLGTATSLALAAAGLLGLWLGARWFVSGAVVLARGLGLSELVIGLTIVAAGTSLPELVTSVVATVRGERDIAVGNVLGSNVFNVLGVLGVSAVVAPASLGVRPTLLTFDIPVLIAVSLACLPVFFTGYRIARWEGALFLAFYAAYLSFVLMTARGSAMLEPFTRLMLWFALHLPG